jgi:hypothetical protein
MLHTDFQPGLLILVKDEKPRRSRLDPPTPAEPDRIVGARCIKIDDDARFWWVSVDRDGRRAIRRVRILEDVVGLPGVNLEVKEQDS